MLVDSEHEKDAWELCGKGQQLNSLLLLLLLHLHRSVSGSLSERENDTCKGRVYRKSRKAQKENNKEGNPERWRISLGMQNVDQQEVKSKDKD